MSDSVFSWLEELSRQLSQAVDQAMGWEPDETRYLQLARDEMKTRKLSAEIRRERMMGFGFRERVIVRMKVQASDLESARLEGGRRARVLLLRRGRVVRACGCLEHHTGSRQRVRRHVRPVFRASRLGAGFVVPHSGRDVEGIIGGNWKQGHQDLPRKSSRLLFRLGFCRCLCCHRLGCSSLLLQ